MIKSLIEGWVWALGLGFGFVGFSLGFSQIGTPLSALGTGRGLAEPDCLGIELWRRGWGGGTGGSG